MRWIPLYALCALVFLGVAHRLLASRPVEATVHLDAHQVTAPSAAAARQPRLRVALAPIVTPIRNFREYKALADLLAAALEVPSETIQRETYASVNGLLRRGDVDVAFVCSGGYASEPDAMDLLAAPVINGKTEYYSLIIVPQHSPAQAFADLRGKEFLFTEKQSNAGTWYPCHRACELKGNDPAFFSSTRYTGGHDLSILAVASGLAQGAAVSSSVFDYMARLDPTLKTSVRILERSPPFPSPPVVVRKSMPLPDRQRLLQALLNLNESESGRVLLRALCIDRFAPARNEDYARVEPCKQ